MGYIHNLNRIEMRFLILILKKRKKNDENSMCDASKNVILIFEIGVF